MTESWPALFATESPKRPWAKAASPDSGVLCWQVAPVTMGCAIMYQATKQLSYLDDAASDLTVMLATAKAYKAAPETLPGPGFVNVGDQAYGGAVYTSNGAHVSFMVHEGRIYQAMAAFVEAAAGLEQYATLSAELLALMNGAKHRYDAFFDAGFGMAGYWTIPLWCEYEGLEGMSAPLNMGSAWARFLLMLNRISPEPWLATTAGQYGRFLLSQFRPNPITAGAVLWPYAVCLTPHENGRYQGIWAAKNVYASDVSHASLDVGLMCELGNSGLVFTQTQFAALALTLTHGVVRNGAPTKWLTGADLGGNWQLSEWPRIAKWAPLVGPEIAAALAKCPDPIGIAQCAELGIAAP